MKRAIQAEWQKINGHRNLVAFLIWIYPIGTLTSVLFIVILPALFSETGKQLIIDSQPQWTDMTQAIAIFVQTPNNIFLRMPLLAFTAVVFAGEYQWGTWKNNLPRASRAELILAKFVVVTALVLLAVLGSSLMWGVGRGIAAAVAGVSYGPAVTGTAVSNFLADYLLNSFVVIVSVLIAAAIAALIAMYTRSILVSLFLAIGYSIVEPVAGLLLVLAGFSLERPSLINLIRFTPSYNLDNVRGWLAGSGSSFANDLPGFTTDLSGGMSLLLLGIWVAVLLFLTLFVFQRQDISE